MSEKQSEGSPKYAKGDALAIVQGKSDVGVRGTIFWTGANKYGPGFRYGLKDDTGVTYWVDEADLGSPEGAPPAPAPKPRDAKDPLEKGTRVEITGGREGLGEEGEVFWVGDSKFGQGSRYGVKTDQGTTYWVDEALVTELAGAKKASGSPSAAPRSGAAIGRRDDANEFSDDFSPARGVAATGDVDPDSMPDAPPIDDAPFDDNDFRDDEDDVRDVDDLPF